MPPLTVKWKDSWTGVPALELVPASGALQNRRGRSFRIGRDLVERFINYRITISRLKDIRTDVGEGAISGAGAVVSEVRELAAADRLEVDPDGAPARNGIGAEPGGVSGTAARDTQNVRVGVVDIVPGSGSGSVDQRLVGRRATDECGQLGMDAGDSEVARELNLSSVLNSGKQVFGGAISINAGEKVRWLDGAVSSASSSEVLGSRG